MLTINLNNYTKFSNWLNNAMEFNKKKLERIINKSDKYVVIHKDVIKSMTELIRRMERAFSILNAKAPENKEVAKLYESAQELRKYLESCPE